MTLGVPQIGWRSGGLAGDQAASLNCEAISVGVLTVAALQGV